MCLIRAPIIKSSILVLSQLTIYVDFIGVDAILSNYSNQSCDEIYMVEKTFLSKSEGIVSTSLEILMACRKDKVRRKHGKVVCRAFKTIIKIF
jgi:hypothetical protein